MKYWCVLGLRKRPSTCLAASAKGTIPACRDPGGGGLHRGESAAFGKPSQARGSESIDVTQRRDQEKVLARLDVGHAAGVRHFQDEHRSRSHAVGEFFKNPTRVDQMLQHLKQSRRVQACLALLCGIPGFEVFEDGYLCIGLPIGCEVDPARRHPEGAALRDKLGPAAAIVEQPHGFARAQGLRHAQQT